MKIELKVAIISGILAIFSSLIAFKTQSDVTNLRNTHENELEKMRAGLAQTLEERKFSFEERRNGYREFFDGTSKYRQYLKLKDQAVEAKESGEGSKAIDFEFQAQEQYSDYIKLWDTAMFKIGVFSDESVVHAIAEYLRLPEFKKAKCDNAEKYKVDIAIYQAMRDEMKADGEVRDDDLILVLFNCIFKE